MKLITEINEDLKVFELEEEGGKKSLFIEGTLFDYIRIATGSKNRYAHRKKEVDIEALIEFRRNRSGFVQNQCFHAPKHLNYE